MWEMEYWILGGDAIKNNKITKQSKSSGDDATPEEDGVGQLVWDTSTKTNATKLVDLDPSAVEDAGLHHGGRSNKNNNHKARGWDGLEGVDIASLKFKNYLEGEGMIHVMQLK